MTPQKLVAVLRQMNEEEGRFLLQNELPLLDYDQIDELVKLLKQTADNQWTKDTEISYGLAGHLLSIGDLLQDRNVYALGLMTRGDALRRMERERDALTYLDAAGKEFLELGDEVGWARTRIGRVSACLQLNRFAEALADAAAAREIFLRHNNFLRAGQIDVNAAMIHYEMGQYKQALSLSDRAIETYQKHHKDVALHVARAKGNKAVILEAMGRFREAVTLHEQARATFAAQAGQEIAVAREDFNIASIYAAQGHYSKALLLFNLCRDIFRRHDMIPQSAEVAQRICSCLLHLNRAQEAYELAEEAAAYFRRSPGDRQVLALTLTDQAEAAMLLGNLRDAAEKLGEARAILEGMGFMRLAARVCLYQAELYFVDGQYDISLREVSRAADAFAEQESYPLLAKAALLQARIMANKGDTVTARELCNQAWDIAQSQGLLDLKYRCDYLLGQIAEHHQDLEAAARYYDRAIRGIEDVQSHLVLDERTGFLQDKGDVYRRAVTLALRCQKVNEALVYVEKAKSRVLGDYLRNNIDIRLRAADKDSEAILEDLKRLREEQAWYSTVVYESESETNFGDTTLMRIRAMKPGEARQELQKRERGIEQLLEQMQLRQAGDLSSRARSHWTDSIVTTLWQKIDRSTLVLEYYLTDTDLYIFLLTRSGVDVRVIEGAVPKLERLFALWRVNLDLAAQASGAEDRAAAFAGLQENSLGLLQRLYDLLLKPVASELGDCQHLVIVPYGMLHYLPFHCLFDGVQFVVEHLNVSYLPAAGLYDLCRQRGKRIRAKGAHLRNSLVLGLTDGGRLAYAKQEAEAVARQLGGICAINEAATTTLLQEAGPRCPVVHIAAHGMFRLDAPNFSHIKLADRQLSTIEVFNLDLSSCSLVTLSACETGRAVVGGVDEVIGLGRGFLYAGAASILPTLWKVDDASSAELMEMFYQVLLSDFSKAAALAGAQRAFLARARTSVRPYRVHPYFWAGFHLIGDAGAL
ncbi:MAG TPA: CHAT domain-containing tetratricopeptide repeat protein [Ktedonobacteraceae bacterium]|jgi:tetratricopeptide (TPR) repeat protein|nr:CHAT domain-containing tetratricopeptide repeat protein [Ktedonobacteraceae bacterium]